MTVLTVNRYLGAIGGAKSRNVSDNRTMCRGKCHECHMKGGALVFVRKYKKKIQTPFMSHDAHMTLLTVRNASKPAPRNAPSNPHMTVLTVRLVTTPAEIIFVTRCGRL